MTYPITPSAVRPELDESSAEAVETVIGLLANRRRRAVLGVLERAGGSATLSEVAEAIATEGRTPEPAVISDHAGVSSAAVRDVRISLHHTHVPKLAAADAIDYDAETRTLTLRERGRTLLDREEAVVGPLR